MKNGIPYVKELDRKPHLSRCGGSLSIQTPREYFSWVHSRTKTKQKVLDESRNKTQGLFDLDERSKRILEMISPKISDKILVIGTGASPQIETFLSKIYKCRNITSGDISKNNLVNAKKILPEVNFTYLDAQKTFPFKDNLFDKVIFTEVLEHLQDERFALQEIHRILKNSGSLILSVPKKRWFSFFNPITHFQHIREYNENTITKTLKQNHFRIVKLIVGGGIYDLFCLWLHLILKYVFRYFHPEIFFKKQVNKTYLKSFKGKGTDIILKAYSVAD